MTVYTFQFIALDSNGEQMPNAVGSFYGSSDTAFVTPIEVTAQDGTLTTTPTANRLGLVTFSYDGDDPRGYWKSGAQSIPVVANEAADTAAAAAVAAQAAAEAAAAATTAPTEATVRTVITTDLADPTADTTVAVSNVATTAAGPVADAVVSDAVQPGGTIRTVTDDQYPNRTSRSKHAPAFNRFFAEAEGAVFDGVTSDSTAINNALLAAAPTQGTVQLPDGKTAGLGAQINIPAGVTLAGRATLFALPGLVGRAILIQNVSNVQLLNFTIDMNKANTAGSGGSNSNWQGVLVSATTAAMSNITIRGVTVKNGWQRGIAAVSTNASFSISNLVVDSCPINTVAGIGIFVSCVGNTDRVTESTSQQIGVINCPIVGDGQGGVQVIGCSHVVIDNNILNGTGSTGHGICLSTSGTTGQVTDFALTRNTVKNYTGSGKWGILVSNNCKRGSVYGNPAVIANTGGISIDPEDSANLGILVDVALTVCSNTVKGSTGGHGINARICKGLTIFGNTSNGNAQSGIAVSNAYAVAVSGNTASSNTQYGIGIFGTNAGTGGHSLGANPRLDNGLGPIHSDGPPVACTFATTSTTPA